MTTPQKALEELARVLERQPRLLLIPMPRGLFNTKDHQTEGQEGRNHSNPEDQLESSPESDISTMAASGPKKAPTVSSDWRSPKLAPRSLEVRCPRSRHLAVHHGSPCRAGQ